MKTLGLSKAQQRAVNWLPQDGSWRVIEKGFGRSLSSLKLYHPDCVEWETGKFGPRGGESTRWRLTENGVAKFFGAKMKGAA